jgi:protein ImuB
MIMRIAAAHFPSLGIEIVRQREEAPGPLAIVWAKPGGAVEREVDVIGGSRIGACSTEAHAFGVRPGMTIAAARAKVATLSVRVVFHAELAAALERLAEVALQWGPTVSALVDAQVVLVDVTGSAHLFKGGVDDGERAILEAWQRVLVGMGHEAALVVAEGPHIAELIARFGQWQRRFYRPIVVPSERTREAVGRLPVNALPLDESDHIWLQSVGLERLSDLRAQPPSGLGQRLRGQGPLVMQLIEGEDRSALLPYVPHVVPEETVHLEHAVDGVEPLLFIVKMLCDRIGARLAGRQERAGRFELELSLDCGLRNKKRRLFVVQLSSPISKPHELFAVMRAKLEEASLEAPSERATLRAHDCVRALATMGHLFERERKSDQSLRQLIAELAADIGPEHVGTLCVRDTWVQEARSALEPAQLKPSKARPASVVRVEPLRMVTCGVRLERASLEGLKRLQRFEWVEWWKRGRGGSDWASAWARDLGATVMVELGPQGVWLKGVLD